jgi:hypothetical protein
MNFSEKAATGLMIIIGLLWLAIMVAGVTGNGLAGLYFAVALTTAHGIYGASQNRKIDKALLFYPVILYAILEVIYILGMGYYEKIFRGVKPDFTVLGFHPSYFFLILFFWLGGVVTWAAGLYALRKRWLADEVWEMFKKKIMEIDSNGGAA